MKVEQTSLDGVVLIKPELFSQGDGELSHDERGMYLEIYNVAKYKKHGIDLDFVEDDVSVSKKDVLRGIHGNNKTWKLVSCVHGQIFFVVVNCDSSSSSFGKWESFDLSDSNHYQVLVPPKYGNGYLALTDKVIFHYKQSSYYDRSGQFSYRWDDPKFRIDWPIKSPILSERDSNAKYIDSDENTAR